MVRVFGIDTDARFSLFAQGNQFPSNVFRGQNLGVRSSPMQTIGFKQHRPCLQGSAGLALRMSAAANVDPHASDLRMLAGSFLKVPRQFFLVEAASAAVLGPATVNRACHQFDVPESDRRSVRWRRIVTRMPWSSQRLALLPIRSKKLKKASSAMPLRILESSWSGPTRALVHALPPSQEHAFRRAVRASEPPILKRVARLEVCRYSLNYRGLPPAVRTWSLALYICMPSRPRVASCC